MNIKELLKKSLIMTSAVVICAHFPCYSAYAADASVVFGSDSYESQSGEEFRVGLYIDADDTIGYYKIEVEYDPSRIEYISGGVDGGDGTVVFEGSGNDKNVSTMLYFRALSGGDTKLSIKNAQVFETGNSEEFVIAEKTSVPVSLKGEDIVVTTQETTAETTESTQQTETTEQVVISETQTTDAEKESQKSSADGLNRYAVPIIAIPAAILSAIILILLLRSRQRKKKARMRYESVSKKLVNAKTESVDKLPEKEAVIDTPALKEDAGAYKKKEAAAVVTDEGVSGSLKPIIEVKNVSMVFKVSTSNASSLKEYMVQKVKGKAKSRKFKALDDISFDVYKGEIVGIIGTNGSGKSTLLKIVSGALLPTSGEVIADKQKIQLLTLGTGFDGELSARENVYLNGAIIGYTKEFIDKHYDEIVEFAELQDFMEEKVKNFSSGMVSRLGFSIATVAGAAEILILDEVLSVGDQFFRKKSLERIQQMIHGGSTVLIVSHSLPTIKAHCTKVVWIEKGVLRMVGDPGKVCDAYARSHETDEG